MTDQEINIAIAEACGWRKELHENDWDVELEMRRTWTTWIGPDGDLRQSAPNYCTDLNAMHEAEGQLTGTQMAVYRQKLKKEFSKPIGYEWDDGDGAIHATARQRAEAFLRTIGKWTDK